MSRADVLVVDDDLDALRVLVDLLEYHGFRVRAASSGRQALIAAGAVRPDLMLLDVSMADGDGFTVLETLRRDSGFLDLPVLLLSGASHVPYKVTGLDLGAVDYIEKPFEPAELLARIRTHLRLAGARHAAAEVLGTTLPALLSEAGLVDARGAACARLARELAEELGLPDPWRVELCVLLRAADLAGNPGRLAGLPGLGEVARLLSVCGSPRQADAVVGVEPVLAEIVRVVDRVLQVEGEPSSGPRFEEVDLSDCHPELVSALRKRATMR